MKFAYPVIVASSASVAFATMAAWELRHQEAEISELRRLVAHVAAATGPGNGHRDTAEPTPPVTRQSANGVAAERRWGGAVGRNAREEVRIDGSNMRSPPTDPQRNAYEALFAADPPDEEWGRHAREPMLARLSSLLPKGSTIRSLECHAKTCRLETDNENTEHFIRFYLAAFMNPSTRIWLGSGGHSSPVENGRDEHGPLTIVSYVPRAGATLAEVAN